MKFSKLKIFSLLACSATLMACQGGATQANLTTVYNANPSSQGTATYLKQPMEMVITNVETVSVYDDNTYELTVATTVVTNLTAIKEGNDQVINRGGTTVEYQGNYSLTVDSGITLLTLETPTNVTFANSNELLTGGFPTGYYDLAQWDETYAEALGTWWTAFGGGSETSAANILDKFAFDQQVISISESGLFDYLPLGFTNVMLGM